MNRINPAQGLEVSIGICDIIRRQICEIEITGNIFCNWGFNIHRHDWRTLYFRFRGGRGTGPVIELFNQWCDPDSLDVQPLLVNNNSRWYFLTLLFATR